VTQLNIKFYFSTKTNKHLATIKVLDLNITFNHEP